MRFSMLSLIALLTMSGCADKGAFDLFKMDAAHERSVEELRTGSIVPVSYTYLMLPTNPYV